MNGFFIFTSNYLEILAEQLARVVREPLSDPFLPEVIVVQSSGMQRWVSMELARHNGICANCHFPFPNRFLSGLFSGMNPDLLETSPFDPGILTFRIMQLLPECLESQRFQSLATYLAGDEKKIKLYQLSRKIADTFDQYLVFRPDMIFNWEAGRADHWQAVLWRKLCSGIDVRHRAALRNDLHEWIRKQSGEFPNLPERVSVFGISYLPLFHLQTLAEISRKIPVYLYLMNPCREYWADIVSDKERVRLQRKFVETLTDGNVNDLHLESGNRLLASLGVLGRDFFDLISTWDFTVENRFLEPGRNSLLNCIQSDLLNLSEPATTDHSSAGSFDADGSVQIHACHSPMREIEVLYDQLLDMLENTPDLMPKDVVVMTPDIETYAPFIHAVFDVQDETGVRIPFTIADRSLKRESRAIEAILSIFDLKNSRLGVARVLSLLEFESVRDKFSLSESDLETVRHWVTDLQIRWGRDNDSRGRFIPGGFSEYSWQQGLERLLLGYAMPGHDKNMFRGILPYDPIEGDNSLILGRFLEFVERLFSCIEKLDQNKKLEGWSLFFNNLLEQFVEPSETTERDIRILRNIFDELSDTETLAGYHDTVTFEVVRAMIEARLEKENYGHGFISGGVTFCAMLPMRSIPFEVVCLVGMNGDSFPRQTRPLGFDLMAKHPKPGDRSRRNDDKYLFLEALISARSKLYISYVGQSLEDNSTIPPSVLVSELIDYLKNAYDLSEEWIVTRHPLQAFSPVYFSGSSRYFSYSRENLLGAARLAKNDRVKQDPPAFFSEILPIPPAQMDKWNRADLRDFCAFWTHPAKFLLQRRLGLYLEEETPLPAEREDFNLNPLQRYSIGQKMVALKISREKSSDLLRLLKAQGQLPVGSVGRGIYQHLESDVDRYIDKSEAYRAERVLPPLDVDVELEGFHLTGRLEGFYSSSGPVHFHYANFQTKYLLKLWIHHLVYNLIQKDRRSDQSFLVCKNTDWEFLPVSAGEQILSNLIWHYRQGLTKPLHFFPETSFVYAQHLLQKRKNQPLALATAQKQWVGSDFHRGESQDPYLSLLYRRSDPLDDQFHEISVSVFTPVFQYGRELADLFDKSDT